MQHTRYIKFNYYDNDFMFSVADTIKMVFCNEMFNVVVSNVVKQIDDAVDKLSFSDRWERFDDFLNDHYRGDVNKFARRLSTIITVSHYIYHNLMHEDYDDMKLYGKVDIKDNKSILKDIESALIPKTRIKVDINFVDSIDTDEDWNDETIYLDMNTGIAYFL